jgi:xanthine dehydrogenase YagR molybdenum-binding subunit
MPDGIGTDHARIDGHAKVTGSARYPSDMPVNNPAYGWLATSAIARGRITAIDEAAARAVPGVLEVFSHRNMRGAVAKADFFAKGGYVGSTIRPMESEQIWHNGQIIALVVADSLEAAREAARLLKVEYIEECPAAGFGSEGAETKAASDAGFEDPKVCDADAAFAAAEVKVAAEYSTPTQHHNPIELFTTTAVWSGGQLTIHEPSQFVHGMRHGIAAQLNLDPADVHVVSPFVGGAFGAKGALTQRTALVAEAARRLRRPVKLVPTREQGFTIATYRAETRHRVRLAASRDGKLLALVHEGEEVTSRPDAYKVAGTATTARVYACPNVRTKVSMVHADRNTPGFMRSPSEVPYMFALESAMDELAYALRMDPVELRRLNDTQHEAIKGVPYSSRNLVQCLEAGARAFGWERRSAEPRSMRDGDWLVGWGCATSIYPTHIGAASARVTLFPNGEVRVQTAAHDVGTGAYTAIGLAAAQGLGVKLAKVQVELGNSDLPPAPVAGGSNTTASVCTVVMKACDEIRARRAQGRQGAIEVYAENIPEGLPPEAIGKLYQGRNALGGGLEGEKSAMAAFGAVFVEVRVHARTQEVRVPRITGAFAAGRIVSPRQARSQLTGGLIWGISAALHEETEIDRRVARYMNDNLSEYLIPVNADIQQVEVVLLEEDDSQVNPLGIKGIGELGNVGTNAAVANAVFHATGIRQRHLPVRIEKLLARA